MEKLASINVIPAYASVEEGALFVAESVEVSFNEMMKEIGISELRAVEEGVMLEAEEEKVKFSAKAKEWLQSIWQKIKGLWAKALAAIQSAMGSLVKKVKSIGKGKENLKKFAQLIKDTDKDGKEKVYLKGHKWSGFDDAVSERGKCWDVVNTFAASTGKVKNKNAADSFLNNAKNDLNRNGSLGANFIKEDLDDAKDKVKNILDISTVDTASIQSAIVKIIKGEEIDITKNYIVKNFEDIWKYAADYSFTSGRVKGILNATKKQFDDDIKWMQKNAEEYPEEILKGVINMVKEAKQILVAVNGGILSALKQRSSESSRIIFKLATAARAKEDADKKQKVNEAYTAEEEVVESATFQTELASLFQF